MSAPVKAYFETETGDTLTFMFNPETLSVTRNVAWKSDGSPGEDAPSVTYQYGAAGEMSFTLWFDTTATGQDVTIYTNQLIELTRIDEDLRRPPWVQFKWGDLEAFKAVIKTVALKFNYFAAGGTPLRASAALTLTQFAEEASYPLQNPTSGTRKRERIHRVQPGETLDRIAYTAYGDSTQWRVIANRNRVMDPLRLPPGMRLILPEREAAARGG